VKILKNKEYKAMIDYQVEQLRKICDLQKEIERLKNELENVKAHYETEAEARYYEFIDNHKSKLQQRISKAIEYLTEEGVCILNKGMKENERLVWDWQNYYDLLDILKGVDNE